MFPINDFFSKCDQIRSKTFFVHCNHRSSRPDVFCKKCVLRNFAKLTRKHLCQSLFFDKVAGLRPATLLKKRAWRRCFPVNFAKFLRTPFLQNTSGRLLILIDKTYSHSCFGETKANQTCFEKSKKTSQNQVGFDRQILSYINVCALSLEISFSLKNLSKNICKHMKVKSIQFSIAHAFVYFKCFNTVEIAHACLQRIFLYGRVYLHFTYHDIYVCYIHIYVCYIQSPHLISIIKCHHYLLNDKVL